MSRGPLREAIRELAEIGLLVSVPYKGLYVRSVTARDLDKLYLLRTQLESFALMRCWDFRTPESIADLKGHNQILQQTIDQGTDGFGTIEQ